MKTSPEQLHAKAMVALAAATAPDSAIPLDLAALYAGVSVRTLREAAAGEGWLRRPRGMALGPACVRMVDLRLWMLGRPVEDGAVVEPGAGDRQTPAPASRPKPELYRPQGRHRPRPAHEGGAVA